MTITGDRADKGGGVRNLGGTLTLNHVTIRGNSAPDLDGGLFNDGTAALSYATVTGDRARVGGVRSPHHRRMDIHQRPEPSRLTARGSNVIDM
jgi:hypothetical protein